MLRKLVLLSVTTLGFSVGASCVFAERTKILLDEDECYRAFLAVVNSERIDYENDYPFLFEIKGDEADTLWEHPSVWFEYIPRASIGSAKETMEAQGFRTPKIWLQSCEVRIMDGMPGTCTIGIALENYD